MLEALEQRNLMAVDTSTASSAFLSIYVDSQKVAIPANLGVNANDSTAPIFTTDTSGKVFFGAGSTVTLDTFFDTWRTNGGLAGNNANSVLSFTQLMNKTVDRDHTIQIFVNGQLSPAFEQQQILNGDHIVVVYSANTVLSLNTNFGPIVVELFDSQKPITVANFLNYVNDGDYINSFFHRSADSGGQDFVIQGGGFKTNSTTFTSTSQFTNVPTDAPILNEPGISNIRGTIAMAKTSDPNSATSQFFVNLNNNTALNSPTNSGGFTVFGQVLDMTTADTISHLENKTGLSSPYGELPVGANNQLVVIQSIEGQGEVSGIKFNDLDGDGVKDANEAGIPGVIVWADTNNDGSITAGEVTATTAADGFYQLHLEPGTYVIRSMISSGFESTKDAVSTTVEIGGTNTVNLGEILNTRPTTAADGYTVNEDEVLTINAAAGVLANDSGTNGPLSASVATQPAHGTLALNADGSFTYTPNANFNGSDTFTYIASDATSQSIATTVSISVVSKPDAPTATNDSFNVPSDSAVQTLNVLANDSSNPDAGQAITITAVTQGSAGGTVSINGSAVNYQPAAGFSGTETFTYTITDTDNLTATATVTITVGEASTNNVISGFVYFDKNGNGLRDANEAGVPGSLLTLTGTTNQGVAVTRTAISDINGAYSFSSVAGGTYQVAQQQPMATLDGAESSSVAGAVTTVNDKISNIVAFGNSSFAGNNFGEGVIRSPYVSIAWFFASSPSRQVLVRSAMAEAEARAGNVALAESIRNGTTPSQANTPQANADTFSVLKNGSLVVTAANGVLKNDTDPNGDTLTASVVTGPTHGTLTLNENGAFTYTPNEGYSGSDSFTYRASDGVLSSTAAVTIHVASPNGTPQAINDSYSVVKNETLNVNAANGVLKNDTDPEGSTLTASTNVTTTHGTLTLNADGSFIYIPNLNFIGTDTFTYIVSDGALTANGTVTITVSAENNPPQTNADAYTVAEDGTLTIDASGGVLSNDLDPENDPLVVSITPVTPPQNGTLTLNADGSFTYIPNANFTGTDTFRYSVTDGHAQFPAEATATITVTPVNDAPVAAGDGYQTGVGQTLTINAAAGVLSNDTDVEGDVKTAQLVDNPAHGTVTLNADGSFTYTPTANFHGTDTFTYKAKDATLSSATTSVTILVDDAPVALADTFTANESQALSVDAAHGVLANDEDPNNDDMTALLVTNPLHGTLDLHSDGSFVYTPVSGYTGPDSFQYRASAGSLTSSITQVNITVNADDEEESAGGLLASAVDQALNDEDDWLTS